MSQSEANIDPRPRLIKTCGLHLDFSPPDPHTNGVREEFLQRSLVQFDINFDESTNVVYSIQSNGEIPKVLRTMTS